MTQALELKPGMKVLEVGTASGYQAAILAEITPDVITIEIIRPLYAGCGRPVEKARVQLGKGTPG